MSTEKTATGAELPEVITPEELAALLRISRGHTYALIRAGKVPGVVDLGRRWRISRDTVLRWLAQGSVGASGGTP